MKAMPAAHGHQLSRPLLCTAGGGAAGHRARARQQGRLGLEIIPSTPITQPVFIEGKKKYSFCTQPPRPQRNKESKTKSAHIALCCVMLCNLAWMLAGRVHSMSGCKSDAGCQGAIISWQPACAAPLLSCVLRGRCEEKTWGMQCRQTPVAMSTQIGCKSDPRIQKGVLAGLKINSQCCAGAGHLGRRAWAAAATAVYTTAARQQLVQTMITV